MNRKVKSRAYENCDRWRLMKGTPLPFKHFNSFFLKVFLSIEPPVAFLGMFYFRHFSSFVIMSPYGHVCNSVNEGMQNFGIKTRPVCFYIFRMIDRTVCYCNCVLSSSLFFSLFYLFCRVWVLFLNSY